MLLAKFYAQGGTSTATCKGLGDSLGVQYGKASRRYGLLYERYRLRKRATRKKEGNVYIQSGRRDALKEP